MFSSAGGAEVQGMVPVLRYSKCQKVSSVVPSGSTVPFRVALLLVRFVTGFRVTAGTVVGTPRMIAGPPKGSSGRVPT